ncbi:MAG: toluene tolerance protein [Gammaproteobacteria bacterium]|nr:MAG: toluene tolerance protein [Gammaproteobacteria bacterium]
MNSISAVALKSLIAESRLLEADGFGPKVVESPDGKVIHKLFRRKRWLSSALLRPYAIRFWRNAQRLQRLGFATVNVIQVSRCRQLGYHLLSYNKVPGQSLRDLIKEAPRIEYFVELGQFVARLHRSGVYFRSLHLGNLLWDNQQDLALIDIADMRFYRRPLSVSERLRNFRPLLNRVEDREIISRECWCVLVDAYVEASAINESLSRTIYDLGGQLRPASLT